MFRYRYINTTPVVFAAESWSPLPGEEREFDHLIDHAFLQLVVPVVEATPEPPVKSTVADEPKSAVTGDDDTEGQ